MTPSWHLKLQRADAHLAELSSRLREASQGASVRVDERVEGDLFVYSIRVEVDVSEMLPVILGDALFNFRSALDHIAVANVPSERRRSASFPLLDRDPASDKNAASAWCRATTGMPKPVVDIIDLAQPFRSMNDADSDVLTVGEPSLALLHSFQNADKHRELTVVLDGLRNFSASHSLDPEPRPFGEHGILKNGSDFLTSGMRLEVSASGIVDFVLRQGHRHYQLADALDAVRAEVRAVVSSVEEAMMNSK